MTCTRKKESPAAIVLGAMGSEVRIRLGRGRSSLVLPGGSLRFDGEPAISEPIHFAGPSPEPSLLVTVLPEDASPAKVYS